MLQQVIVHLEMATESVKNVEGVMDNDKTVKKCWISMNTGFTVDVSGSADLYHAHIIYIHHHPLPNYQSYDTLFLEYCPSAKMVKL